MSKNRRKVTVEGEKSSDEEGGSKRSKPSVFERLGPGASSSRKSFEGDRQDAGLYLEKCRNWLKTGSCHYGPTCRFIHGPFTSGRSKRKGGEGEEDSGDEGKHRKHRTDKDKPKARSQSLSPKRLSRGHGRKEKDAKMKSAVIVKKSVGGGGGDSERESDSTPWDAEDSTFDDLDYKDELQLEQKRQELERVLRQLQPSEEERENITIEKKQVSSSSGSSSSSSGSSSSSSSSSSDSPSPPRKKSPRRPKTPPRHSRSPPRHYGKSPPHPARTPPSHLERTSPYRNKATSVQDKSRSSPSRDQSPLSLRERPSKRETTPPPAQPRERSPPVSPQRPPSPRHLASWSPEKGSGHVSKGSKLGGKKKKVDKQKEKSRSRQPHVASPPDWELEVKDKDRDRRTRMSGNEKEKAGHREKHKRRNRSPVPEEKPRFSVRDGSVSPRPRSRSKPKAVHSPSPEPDRKRSEGSGRQEGGSDYGSPIPKTSRKSISPVKERSKRGKRRGRTLSVSPLRTKKLSPVPKSKDLPKETEKEPKKEKVKGGSTEPVFHQEKPPEPQVKERSRGRSPAQASSKAEKHKKKKDYLDKKKRHDSPDVTPPAKHLRKRKDSPETPVKQSKKVSKERGGPETPGRRSSKSKSGKRKEGRKGQKCPTDWEQSPIETEEKGRSRGAGESLRLRPSSPEPPPPRGRDKRHSSPQDVFAARSRSGDSRRPGTPPPRRPESPPEVFRPGMRGSPPRFARSVRDDPAFSSGMRRHGDDEFGRPPGASSPSGRRSREGRYRDDFEPGLGRRDLDPDGPGRLDRFMDPRDRERLARFPDLRPPLYDEGPASRLEQERLFEMERARFEREADRLRGREGFERERFGRDRFSGRPERFDDGRGGPLVGRDPRGLGISAPPWEREFGGAGLSGRGLAGERFPGRGGYDDDLPERLSRRGEWEGRHMDFRDDWGPRGRDDRRTDLRMGRRGEFLDMRDSRRFEEPGMFRRMDREEMLRLRLEGDYRGRREPSNPRESLYVDLRREDRVERRDDRLERSEEAFERGRRDEHLDKRLLRRDEREGGRMDRRDNLRKRPFDLDDDKPQSPVTKRLREHSPSAISLRSHGSNLDETRAAEWERVELRRRDLSQETDRSRRERDQDPERPAKRGRDAEGDWFRRETEKSREHGNQEGGKGSIRGESRGGEKEGEADGEQRRDRRKKAEEQDRLGGRRRGRDRSKGAGPEKEDERERSKSKDDASRDKSLGRASVEGEEREADHESVKSSSRESAKEWDSRRGRSANRERERDSETMSEKIWPRDKGWEPGRDSAHTHERDRDTQSEKAWAKGDWDDRGSVSGRSRQGERPHSDYGEGDRGRRRERRLRGAEKGSLERGDTESEKGSSKGSAKRRLKSLEREGGSVGEKEHRDASTSQGRPESPDWDKKGDKSEKYDPFAVESDDEPVEGGTQEVVKTGAQDAGILPKSVKPKRRLSPEVLSTQGDEDGDRKKQKMIELSEGALTEMPQSELKREEELRSGSVPFTGNVSDKEELKSAGGEVYSDWSSADDADEILGRPEAVPFTSQTKNVDMDNGDSQSTRSNQDRRRRSASRSSHGSRREQGHDMERGRARIREERTQDDRGHRSRPSSRHSSRHSSYDPRRDDRRRYGSTEPATSQVWDRGDAKPDISQSDGSKAQSLQPDEEDGYDKSEILGTSMDYETISDDGDIGVEEDADTKGVVSALHIDWSSLTQDQRPASKPGSALQRFKPASVFQRIGIEKVYAGEELFNKLKSLCQAELEKDEAPKEPRENGEEKEGNGAADLADPKDSSSPEFKLHHDTAAFHASSMCKLKERMNLFRNIGSFRRALCARRDLDIRRQLCRLDKPHSRGANSDNGRLWRGTHTDERETTHGTSAADRPDLSSSSISLVWESGKVIEDGEARFQPERDTNELFNSGTLQRLYLTSVENITGEDIYSLVQKIVSDFPPLVEIF